MRMQFNAALQSNVHTPPPTYIESGWIPCPRDGRSGEQSCIVKHGTNEVNGERHDPAALTPVNVNSLIPVVN
jgi:hypothetical protein